MSVPRVSFRPAQLANLSPNDDATNRNFRELAAAITRLQSGDTAISSGGTRIWVASITGVGPWAFGLADEPGLLCYELELGIIDPPGDTQLRLNADAGANYGDISGVARNQATVAVNPGGPPGAVRGVVEIRGIVTGVPRSIGCARVTSFETGGPSVSPNPGDYCWKGVAALSSVSVFDSVGAAAATSSVKLFKIMQV